MTEDRTVEPAEAVWLLAGERITEVTEPLNTITDRAPKEVNNPYINRRSHIDEFLKTALARVSDAVELLEESNDLLSRARAVEELLSSADVFLEAIQDLLIKSDENELANEIGHVRQSMDKIQRLVSIVAEEAEDD